MVKGSIRSKGFRRRSSEFPTMRPYSHGLIPIATTLRWGIFLLQKMVGRCAGGPSNVFASSREVVSQGFLWQRTIFNNQQRLEPVHRTLSRSPKLRQSHPPRLLSAFETETAGVASSGVRKIPRGSYCSRLSDIRIVRHDRYGGANWRKKNGLPHARRNVLLRW